MNIKKKNRIKSIISAILVCVMSVGVIPAMPIFATQISDYVDPADHWLSSNGRNNELDMNATTTYETGYCAECDKETTVLSYRVPEYTRSGETALNRGVKYSDGTMIDGENKGNLDDGMPGVDASYTGYHFTKSVCQTCGTINAIDGKASYSFNKNVYSLNACDHNFFLDFDSTTYEPYSSTQHTTTMKAGQYCQFCKGTYAKASTKRETHNFKQAVDAQLGNNRFYVSNICEDCGYESSEYVTAKSVIASYYGNADGEAHTLTVSDLSEGGVNTKIRYGTEAGRCNLTSAPNYTSAGYYTVYYEINYTYSGTTMTENGVSYVWLVDDNKNNDGNGVITHEHDYHFLETVAPSCTNLGYDRFQCNGCGNLIKTNYTPATGHNYKSVTIREATCKQGGLKLQMCDRCGDFHEETTSVSAHSYKTEKHNPTCQNIGYTDNICEVCGDNYITNITPLISHAYDRITKEPTCVDKGYTTYTCTMCGYNYVSDYTEPTGHDWDDGHAVTNSTCESEGVMEYNCKSCGEKMIKATSANGHKAGKAATCTEAQTCENCGTVLELPTGHHYNTEIVPSTCTAMGYTVYMCHDCDDTYIGDYTDKIEHTYNKVVTPPNCINLGFTTYTCADCGNEINSDYVEATGHNPSDWIVDVPATIEGSGNKHIECTVCGETLKTIEIPKLPDNDNSDEDGHSKVGDYYILITDKNNKPVFDSEISIDKNDNITIKLPDGRLISAEDITTITVTDSRTQQPATDINIFISDTMNNAATGKTDVNGQLKVPNTQSSTGDSNGTVTDNEKTYVVIATDKNGGLIPNCNVTVGDNYSIDVKLPDGTAFDKDNRITVTVVTEKGEPVSGLRVQLIGDGDFVENGYTNIKGQLTLPMSNTDITDDKGNGEVGDIKGDKIHDYIVTVSDESGLVKDALITLVTDDNAILVCLPDGKIIDYFNRTTIKVTRSNGEPISDWKVSVYNKDGSGIRTELTDENGIVIVPPLSEAPISKPTPTPNPDAEATPLPGIETTPKPDNPSETDKPSEKPDVSDNPTETPTPSDKPSEPTPTPDIGNGAVVQTKEYKYRVYVWDNDGAITEFGLVKLLDNGNLEIELPSSKTLNPENKVNIKVVNENDNTPVKGITVNVTDSADASALDITNSTGIAIVPVSDTDITDGNGNAQVKDNEGNLYNVNVATAVKGNIEGAVVKIADGKISVKLPEACELTTANQTIVTVTDKDAKPVKNMLISVTDKNSKTAEKSTDANGKITVPVKTSNGSSSGGSSGGGGGSSYVKTTYTVKVVDKDGKTVNVNKTVKDDKIILTLPNGKTLDDNYYTITVTDGKGNVKPDIDVTLKDKDNSVNGKTNLNGQLVLPSTEHKSYIVGYPDGAFMPDGDMSRAEAAAIFARLIAEEKGENITGKASFTDIDKNGWYVDYIGYLAKYHIIEGYEDKTFKPDAPVTRAEFVAMAVRYYSLFNEVKKDGYTVKYTDVSKKYWAYDDIAYAKNIGWINGYADGTFKGDNNITRAEVVTVTNHATGRTADKDYINKNVSTLNKFTDLKNNSHWGYYEIMEAANTHKSVNGANGEAWIK